VLAPGMDSLNEVPLDERGSYARFCCAGSYRVQMHTEQTKEQCPTLSITNTQGRFFKKKS